MQEWHAAWLTEAYRVLKPGGHLLAFGGTRTYHRLACAAEDVGFEIRDSLMWLYGTGFPKSLNLKGERQGWGTALKPAFEPIVLARKPLEGTVATNVAKWGTGALNIDACRIAGARPATTRGAGGGHGVFSPIAGQGRIEDDGRGRWPANVILDPEAGAMLDAQSGYSKDGVAVQRNGGASRFFYNAKVSKKERDAGLEGFKVFDAQGTVNRKPGSAGTKSPRAGAGRAGGLRNNHPTVKPIALMRWLVRLVAPPGGLVLDPFMGSGSTGLATIAEGVRFYGIERERNYFKIAVARMRGAGQ
jgi:site-specific DNA-methyltransferase (adenine-specific)